MANQQTALEILNACQAIITGSHIVYTSGKHGSAYVNKDAVYVYPDKISHLCDLIAQRFAGADVDVVVAPAVGGVILSQWVAYHLSSLTDGAVLGVYADKTASGGFEIKRGYNKLIYGKRVLVVEDIVNTGGSIKKVIEAVRECDGEIVGAGILCNRGSITAQDLEVPELFALVDVKLEAWDEADCPLCQKNIPINTNVGKGREFLARKQNNT